MSPVDLGTDTDTGTVRRRECAGETSGNREAVMRELVVSLLHRIKNISDFEVEI